MFFELASKCKSVVACRFKPDQKAKMVPRSRFHAPAHTRMHACMHAHPLQVREFKNRSSAVTLAIGDGNNDEQMILEANVGVGIAGPPQRRLTCNKSICTRFTPPALTMNE